MRFCNKCGDKIPNHIKINGKWKSFGKRKFCLSCSPFDSKIKRELGITKPIKDGNVTCPSCGAEVKITKTQRNHKCTTCRAKETRNKNKLIIQKLFGSKCCICGYDKCFDALDFHHKDPSKKDGNLSAMWHLSIDKLKAESEKCVLLCANCHREVHGGVVKLVETHET